MNQENLSYSFNTIYTKYYNSSFLFTKSFVHDIFVAEDIVSDSIIKLWESVKDNVPEDEDHLKALLLTILKNQSLDYLKHEAIRLKVTDNLVSLKNRELELRISTLQACDPDEVFSKEIKVIIANTINSLPKQTHKIFIMSRFENRSNTEIAGALNLSVKAVEYHITKTLKILKVNLSDYITLF